MRVSRSIGRTPPPARSSSPAASSRRASRAPRKPPPPVTTTLTTASPLQTGGSSTTVILRADQEDAMSAAGPPPGHDQAGGPRAAGDDPDFVPEGFGVPTALTAGALRLEPLSPRHNEADYAAWTSSIEHIRATPGFAGRNWPDPPMTLEQNLADLQMHAEHFAPRQGFTYTVLAAASGEVIGCVYISPAARPGRDARVRSWVRADHAAQDTGLRTAVRDWLTVAWPFRAVDYDH